jgi:site-specific DNA-methyltransferase (adenine-specific)
MSLPRRHLMIGQAVDRLRTLPSGSIDTVVTSPPYYMLRDYAVAGQIGLEPNVETWVNELRQVMNEVARVLKPTGSLWLNLGDSFSRAPKYGAPAKGLLCAPERLLLALAADGWIVRNKVIWAKPNPMPTSVGDRLNLTYEHLYFLTRSPRYFFDLDAIREPHRSSRKRKASPPIGKRPDWAGPLAGSQDGLKAARPAGQPGHLLGKNPGDVWTIATHGFRGAHFATFPEALVVKPILASCPEAVCVVCHGPWRRTVSVRRIGKMSDVDRDPFVVRTKRRWLTVREVGELVPCGCNAGSVPGIVLDPFFGSGTVGVVAERLGRDWIGIELNPEYANLARARLKASRPDLNGSEIRAA